MVVKGSVDIKNIRIIDMPMGTGKTTGMIRYMNNHPTANNRFIFITPFLDEVTRIKEACAALDFQEPSDNYSKAASLKSLIASGQNIVSTHALFKMMDRDTVELLRLAGYTLVLDEVLEVIEIVATSKRDIQIMLDSGLISINTDGRVTWIDSTYKDGKRNKFGYERNIIENQNVFFVDGRMFMCLFNPDIFDTFREIYVLTYLFANSIFNNYFELFDISYEYASITMDGTMTDEKYDDVAFRKDVLPRIHIYEGRLNDVGETRSSLSATWYQSYIKNAEYLKIVQNNIRNYFLNINKARVGDVLWSSFIGGKKKAVKNRVSPKNYDGGFMECNVRATNKFADRSVLAYPLNIHIHPYIVKYFSTRGIQTADDNFALSQLLQWIWRSRIRNGEEVYLYLPSRRMRELFVAFLNNEISV